MTKLEALKALEQEVAAGKWDWKLAEVWGYPLFGGLGFDAFNGSLDAALSLHQAVLPGWGCNIAFKAGYFGVCVSKSRGVISADGDNIGSAWLLAVIRALITMEERG